MGFGEQPQVLSLSSVVGLNNLKTKAVSSLAKRRVHRAEESKKVGNFTDHLKIYLLGSPYRL
jgi:hypothetical protein